MALPEIVIDPQIMSGKPTIAGTRITVELILEKLAAGEPPDQVRQAHSHLPEGAVEAALAYAAAVIRNENIIPLDRRSA